MTTTLYRATLAWRPTAAAAALLALMASPAHAALISPVTVSLIAPGGIVGNSTPISETATVNPVTGLHSGDLGNQISGFWMLPNESITFSGNAILLHVLAGAGDPTATPPIPFVTGYLGLGGAHARYEFSGLQVLGQLITGYTLTSAAGISGANVSLLSASKLSFDLDTLVFDPAQAQRDGNGYYYGDFTINLLTQPVVTPPNGNVPEPAGWALALGALAALAWSTRRQAGRPAART